MGIWRALFTRRNLVRLLAALAVGALQIYVDPFGFSGATREASYRLMNRLAGPAVEWTHFGKPERATSGDGDPANTCESDDKVDPFQTERSRIRDDIVLVVLRQEDVERYGEIWKSPQAWPLPFGAHAEVIGRIRLADPRAVYVDFVFDDEREDQSLQSLEWAVEEYEAAFWADHADDGKSIEIEGCSEPEIRDIPLYFAGRRHRSDDADRPEDRLTILKALRDHENIKLVAAERDPGSAYELWDHPDEEDEAAGNERDLGPPIVSPALTIYIDQCRLKAVGGCPKVFEGLKDDWLTHPDRAVYDALQAFRERMQVFWGATPSPRNFNEFKCNTEIDAEGFRGNYRIYYYVRYFEGLMKETNCYYNPVATVSSLFRSRPEDVNALLKDKIVIYTADISGVSREIQPPTSSEKLPVGVKHAMALENLIAWGDGYLRTEHRGDPIPIIVDSDNVAMFVFTILTAMALTFSIILKTRTSIRPVVDWSNICQHIYHDTKLVIVYAFAVLVFLVVQIIFVRVSDLDYVELILLSVGLTVVERNKYVVFLETLVAGDEPETPPSAG